MESSTGEAEMPEGVSLGEGRAVMSEGGDQSVKGATGKAAYALGGDDIDIDGLEGVGGAEGGGGGIPDGIDDDVEDGMKRAVAVSGDEEATREGGPELVGRETGDGVEVVAADEAQQQRAHGPSIPWRPPPLLAKGGFCDGGCTQRRMERGIR